MDPSAVIEHLRRDRKEVFGYREMKKACEEIFPGPLAELRQLRPYKMPKTHIDWKTLSTIITISAQPPMPNTIDQATYCHNGLWEAWFHQNAPIYCISTELLRQFQDTDAINLPGLVPDSWVPPMSVFCLALPNSSVMSPCGAECPYLLVSMAHPELPSSVPSEHERQISVSLCDRDGTIWMSGVGFHDGGFTKNKCELGTSATGDDEKLWLQSMVSLALQCAMALTYMPELLAGEPRQTVHKHKTQIHKQQDTAQPLFPRWIGKDFKRTYTQTSNHGSHGSPRTHLRRGHWRHQLVGAGRRDAKLIWVKPAMVN